METPKKRDIELRNAMAEQGFEMTPDEIKSTKESIVDKFSNVMPELNLKDMSTDRALSVICALVNKK